LAPASHSVHHCVLRHCIMRRNFGAVPYTNGKATVNGGVLAYRLYEGAQKARSDGVRSDGGVSVEGSAVDSKAVAPIVLISGWGTVLNDWFALPQELAKLDRTVLMFDNRCIGESADHGGKVNVEEMASDVLELCKQVLPPGPFVALGHSAGAFVVQHLAIHSPEKIAAGVLIGIQGGRKTAINGAPEFFKLARKTYQDQEVLQTLGQATAGSGAGDPVKLADRVKLLAFFITTNRKDPVNRPYRQICQRSLSELRPQPTILAQLKMLGTMDYGARLGEIQQPMLVLHGKDDVVIPPANGELLFKELTGCKMKKFEVLPGRHIPHGPSLADGRAVAKKVITFLAECEKTHSKL